MKQLTEQVWRIIGGASVGDRKIKIQEVDLAVNQSIAQAAIINYRDNRQLEGVGYIDGQFISRYKNVEILFDSDVDQYYSLLPANLPALPRNSGVVSIQGMKGQCSQFIPTDANFHSMFSSLECANIPDTVYYWLESGRVYYKGLSKITKKVLMKLTATGDCEVPMDMRIGVIMGALKILGIEKDIPQDKIVDAIDKA